MKLKSKVESGISPVLRGVGGSAEGGSGLKRVIEAEAALFSVLRLACLSVFSLVCLPLSQRQNSKVNHFFSLVERGVV